MSNLNDCHAIDEVSSRIRYFRQQRAIRRSDDGRAMVEAYERRASITLASFAALVFLIAWRYDFSAYWVLHRAFDIAVILSGFAVLIFMWTLPYRFYRRWKHRRACQRADEHDLELERRALAGDGDAAIQ